jgi:hypothetical protein
MSGRSVGAKSLVASASSNAAATLRLEAGSWKPEAGSLTAAR